MILSINLTAQQIIIILALVVPTIITVIKVMLKNDFEGAIDSIIAGCSTIITFLLMVTFYDTFDSMSQHILSTFNNDFIQQSSVIHILFVALLFIVIKFIIQMVLKALSMYSFFNLINKFKKNKIIMLIMAAFLGILRGIIVLIIISIPIVLYNNIVDGNKQVQFLDGIKPYENMSKLIEDKKISGITSGIIQDVKSNALKQTVYYNGVTIDDAVKSDAQIESKAKTLVSGKKTDRERAKSIYKWVGANIKYDNNKASKVLNNQSNIESGAIIAFNTRRGICFDYASLFTSMAKSVNLKSRVIIGEAFNGQEMVNHAWNQVYLSDEKIWINLDPTFYQAGNYFDNQNFTQDHFQSGVAGEF